MTSRAVENSISSTAIAPSDVPPGSYRTVTTLEIGQRSGPLLLKLLELSQPLFPVQLDGLATAAASHEQQLESLWLRRTDFQPLLSYAARNFHARGAGSLWRCIHALHVSTASHP